MGSFTVLRDIGNSLKKLLKNNITELSDDNSILFDSPGDIEPTTTTRLAIFLYRIMENPYLRNQERTPVPDNDEEMLPPPVVVDLFYLFIPYAQTRETECIVLEKIIQIFNDNAVLRGNKLQGNLKTSGNKEVRIISNTLSLDELEKLWGTFPNKPLKLAVSYIVTPVSIPSEKKIPVKRVEEKHIEMYRKDGDEAIFLEKIIVKEDE